MIEVSGKANEKWRMKSSIAMICVWSKQGRKTCSLDKQGTWHFGELKALSSLPKRVRSSQMMGSLGVLPVLKCL